MDWRLLFLTGCWPEVALCSLKGGPFHHTTWEEPGREYQDKVTVCYNQIVAMTSHHCCCILIRRKSLCPGCFQGEGITQGYEYQETGWESLVAMLETAYHMVSLLFIHFNYYILFCVTMLQFMLLFLGFVFLPRIFAVMNSDVTNILIHMKGNVLLIHTKGNVLLFSDSLPI